MTSEISEDTSWRLRQIDIVDKSFDFPSMPKDLPDGGSTATEYPAAQSGQLLVHLLIVIQCQHHRTMVIKKITYVIF